MPVEIYATCWRCQRTKLRAEEFPSVVQPNGKRRWLVFCRECLASDPTLWNDLDADDLRDWEPDERGRDDEDD